MPSRIDSMAEDLNSRVPSPAPYTVPMALVQGTLEGARLRGHLPDTWLKEADIAPRLLTRESARVSTDQYIALLKLLIARLDDEAIGFLARPLKPGSLELIARAALDETDLLAALRRVSRVMALLQDDLELELVHDGTAAGLALRLDSALWRPRFLHEYMVRILWRLAAWLVGGSLPARRFDFAFEQPPYARQYGVTFPAPLRFGQPLSAFWFDARRLTRPVTRDRAALRSFVASWPAAMIVPRRGNEGIVARVRLHFDRSRPLWPGLRDTAATFHMSAPTLQRHLAAAGTSFQTLKDELRRDIAIVRLAAGQDSLAELALTLGFADSAAFQRAFKGWTGSAPGTYRRRAGA